jgi:hypothetical protein
MKAIKHIALGVTVVLSIFIAVLYSSCAKDQCGAVTCQYKGTCAGGVCTCKPGLEGVNCEIVYRNIVEGTFLGMPPDDPTSDTTNMLKFSADFDSTNYSTMTMTWTDTGGVSLSLPVELTKNSPAGSQFIIPSTTNNSITYTATGSISTSAVTMHMTRKYVGGGENYLTFNNYLKQ